MSIRHRSGPITVIDHANSVAVFTRLCANSIGVLPVASQNFRSSARFSNQYALGLRAENAHHLAVCANYGATLCSLDRRLAEAGPQAGLPPRFCNQYSFGKVKTDGREKELTGLIPILGRIAGGLRVRCSVTNCGKLGLILCERRFLRTGEIATIALIPI